MFALWANVHIQFVYGLGLIGLFALERPLASVAKWPGRLPKLRARRFWALLSASALATLANPYGWHLYEVVVQLVTQSAPLSMIQEMQAMQFRNPADWAAPALAGSAIFALANSRNKSPLLLSLLIVSCWFAFRARRDVWFLAISSAFTLAYSIGASNDGTSRNCPRSSMWKQWMIALSIGTMAAFSLLRSVAVPEIALHQSLKTRFPEQASAYIESHGLRGPLFNPFNWGGYLIWRLPKMPVSIDGRTNLYGDERLARFVATWSGKPDWANDPELSKANTILLERDAPLASILRSDSRYRLVYEDDIASIFQPVNARPSL
jgi:hypothetical protein